MTQPSPLRPSATRAIDPLPVRLVKRAILILLGPLYFLIIAYLPLVLRRRTGFRTWYWNTIKRACSRLLWLLSIRAEMPQEERDELAADTNSVIVINHRSHLDGFALMDVVPDAKEFTFAAKKSFFDALLTRTGFRSAELVEIDRASGSVALGTLSKAVREMDERRSVVLFPEGTRTKGESLGPFKAGAVLVARETGRTIRPIVIHDSNQLLPRGKTMPRSGTIRVQTLAPFHCDPEASTDSDVARLRAEMMAVFDNR